ncbi:universal stress family protein [Kamptonema formosum]|uniref:universal stress family protein n=1 Tax=Kamptonema formosum TaxID=331992 RepID=UPI0008FBD90D|nr:universal stress family protein [Oscillatoria sp. PCC 10802]
MKIKPMLARLESALGRHDIMDRMVLLPEPAAPACDGANFTKPINFVVGYNSSPSSQTALDITLWMAHQTRLATHRQVTVQVVYTVSETQSSHCPHVLKRAKEGSSPSIHYSSRLAVSESSQPLESSTSVLTQQTYKALATSKRMTPADRQSYKTMFSPTHPFEQADRILWQARCLAEEWRGAFKAHLRFGGVAAELRKVVESESAVLLFLGCSDANHPIVRALGPNFPCAVLGIPSMLVSGASCAPASDCLSV